MTNFGSTKSAAQRRWPRAAAMFWRIAFWVTVVHFVGFGCLTVLGIKGMGAHLNPNISVLAAYQRFGLATTAGLILLPLYWVIWIFLIVADCAALWILRRLRSEQLRRRPLAAYLLIILAVLAIHEVAMAGILLESKGLGLLWALLRTYAATVAIMDVLLASPAALLVAGGVAFGWPKMPPPGFCVSCGYNLTGNASGTCPECGITIPRSPGTADYTGRQAIREQIGDSR